MENEYRKLCNQVRNAARQDKDHWLQQQCEDIQQSYEENKSRKTFRLIKDINRHWQPKQLTLMLQLGGGNLPIRPIFTVLIRNRVEV